MSTPEYGPVPRPHFQNIGDYEQWASTAWIHPHGTIEAQLHARGKLAEETQELIDALSEGNQAQIISEAGDVLWTTLANGSNAGITMTEGLVSAFPAYFTAETPISTQDIDTLAATLFDDIAPLHIKDYLWDGERVLGKKAKQWLALGESVNAPEKTFADVWINAKRADALEALTRTTLLISFIAQQYAGAGLQNVLNANYQKIEQRIQAGIPVTKIPQHQVS